MSILLILSCLSFTLVKFFFKGIGRQHIPTLYEGVRGNTRPKRKIRDALLCTLVCLLSHLVVGVRMYMREHNLYTLLSGSAASCT